MNARTILFSFKSKPLKNLKYPLTPPKYVSVHRRLIWYGFYDGTKTTWHDVNQVTCIYLQTFARSLARVHITPLLALALRNGPAAKPSKTHRHSPIQSPKWATGARPGRYD